MLPAISIISCALWLSVHCIMYWPGIQRLAPSVSWWWFFFLCALRLGCSPIMMIVVVVVGTQGIYLMEDLSNKSSVTQLIVCVWSWHVHNNIILLACVCMCMCLCMHISVCVCCARACVYFRLIIGWGKLYVEIEFVYSTVRNLCEKLVNVWMLQQSLYSTQPYTI